MAGKSNFAGAIACFLQGLLTFSGKKAKKHGGVDRSRTDLRDFADRCLTAWLPRRLVCYIR